MEDPGSGLTFPISKQNTHQLVGLQQALWKKEVYEYLLLESENSMRYCFLILSMSLLFDVGIASEGNGDSSLTEPRPLIAAKYKSSMGDDSCEAGSADNSTYSLINHTFCRYTPKFDSQYRRALRDDAFLEGNVTLMLDVSSDGKVASVAILQSDLDHSELERRFLMIASAMKFPGIGPGGWKGEYTIRFSP
ncbi:TonB family protein [Alcanivorax sp. VBW004]|uniref:TonB family protein n=1 Tax=Alcanivorax sp. VBW004 TaxID=1287708 RepID=UPI0012BBCB1B|nr:TonB family protein [Alcanivorax sp. VBW004]MTT53745.1 TonB family protein [Alcanivorax sp. VBW004]